MQRALLVVSLLSVGGALAFPTETYNTPVLHPSIASKYKRFVQEAGAKPPDTPLEHPEVFFKGRDGTVVLSSRLSLPDDMLQRYGVRYRRHGGGKPVDLFVYVIKPDETEDGDFRDPRLPVPFHSAQRLFRRFLLERQGYEAVAAGTREGTEAWRVESTPRGLFLHLPGAPGRRLTGNPDSRTAGDCLKEHGTRIVRSAVLKGTTYAEVEYPRVVGDWEGAGHCTLGRTLVEVRQQGTRAELLCDGETCEAEKEAP